MLGGKEPPCVAREFILQIQAKGDGRYCPRVELWPENQRPAELALFAAKAGADNPIWARLFDLYVAEMPPERQREELTLILNVLGDEGVVSRVRAEREREYGGKHE